MESGKRRKKRRAAILRREILILEIEILRLEEHLRIIHGSKISASYSYQQTASDIENKIQQKRKEIIELGNTSNEK